MEAPSSTSTAGPAAAERSFRGVVRVFPRREILDPVGKAISSALGRLGFDDVGDVRAGKSFEVELRAANAELAQARLEEICRRLLANPIIEDYLIDELEAQT